ncbi:sensor histidine kinase [Catellatospora sichuanensis]|uniref:sensor histidine kinase n=1 Tax=Catellatospora sichuanensis TaxID=1969805 RepID=UPI0011834D25|nr:HAMP domain-containing sensor histidine kinase [Catellatospora sichuanensis]
MKGSWHGSLRVRHTLMFGLMFLLAGSAVLGGVLILVQNSMDYSLAVVFARKLEKYSPDEEPWLANAITTDEVSRQIIMDSMRDNLLFKGGLTLLGVCVAATAAAWWLSGRLLRPLNMITDTAHRIAGRTLHKRIELDGPPSEVKSLADSFDSMLDRLDEAFAGQGRFIANAAHELKTPIAVNRTLLDVAMARPDSPPQMLRLGENLLAVNLRHERLIDSLLTLARAEEAVTDRRPVDLAQLAGYALDFTAKAAAEQRVQVQAQLAAAPVLGDPILLEQLIRNLVDNAVRYNHPHGFVWVQTLAEVRQVEIIVTNTGVLISPHEVPALFEPFRRLTDRVGSARGSGLGLSIVRAVAQAHGGDALAIPRPDGGLSVRVILPRSDALPA